MAKKETFLSNAAEKSKQYRPMIIMLALFFGILAWGYSRIKTIENNNTLIAQQDIVDANHSKKQVTADDNIKNNANGLVQTNKDVSVLKKQVASNYEKQNDEYIETLKHNEQDLKYNQAQREKIK